MNFQLRSLFASALTVAGLASATLLSRLAATAISPLPDQVDPVIADRQDAQVPDRVHLTGWVGTRMAVNESNRLAKLDVDRLWKAIANVWAGSVGTGNTLANGFTLPRWLGSIERSAAPQETGLRCRRTGQMPASDGYLGTILKRTAGRNGMFGRTNTISSD